MKPAALAVLLAALVVAASPAVTAQGPPQPVRWSVVLEPAAGSYAHGAQITAVATATIDEGWHVYSADELPHGPQPLRIDIDTSGPATRGGPLVAPEPERDFDQAFGQVTAFYTATTVFRRALVVNRGAKAGPQSIVFLVSFQACDGRMCLPGRVVTIKVPLTIAPPTRPTK
jgi:hypothetical protein